ncbi:hypothetical protein BT96DRAFT_998031 [Gymnopus androsaceus JB14]|uniref:Uncharacterized protein n=1 Tax=Gymnopus androsaceus JB14 TaxID=1447944 RepID=A0A6A4HBK4_9AGAR|nr:hypothetical protein BT96DRAFT_998031 [Gymnopus androsaceus JB14]
MNNRSAKNGNEKNENLSTNWRHLRTMPIKSSPKNRRRTLHASSNVNSGILGMAFGAEYTNLLETRTTAKANKNVPDVPHVPVSYEDLYTVRARMMIYGRIERES